MQLTVGSIVEGKVTGITKFGAFIDLGEGKTGMVHISEVASSYVKEIRDHLTEEQMVKVKVLTIGEDGKIGLSIKRAEDPPARPAAPRPAGGGTYRRPNTYGGGGFNTRGPVSGEKPTFEDMMTKFKQTSDDKMSDLKRVMDVKRGSANRRNSSK